MSFYFLVDAPFAIPLAAESRFQIFEESFFYDFVFAMGFSYLLIRTKTTSAIGNYVKARVQSHATDIAPSQISEFETGKREPSLIVVLQYARLANVCAEVLIDDALDLPAKLPAKPKHK